MLKVAFLFVLVAAALAYEEAPLDYKGDVIDTKDVLIAKEKHYAAWDKANYELHHGHEGHYDPHYDGHYDHLVDPHHAAWVDPDHKW